MVSRVAQKVVTNISYNHVTSYTRNDYKRDRKLSKKEMKRIRKARERAEMDAFEDMIMYMEVFSDD